jgi:hypothetical protein
MFMKNLVLTLASAAFIVGGASAALAQASTYFPDQPTKQTDRAGGYGYGYNGGNGGYGYRGYAPRRGFEGYRGEYGYGRYGY